MYFGKGTTSNRLPKTTYKTTSTKLGMRNLLHYSHLWQITVVRAPGFGSSLAEERFSSSCWQFSRWCISRCTLAASEARDRKSTRLNSSHVKISYAVFCLKKKKKKKKNIHQS